MQNNRPSLTPRLLALIPLAVGINLAMGKIVAALALPVFLDTVGTVLVAALAGTWPAVITGFVSQIAFTVLDARIMWLFFLPVQLFVALYAGLAATRAAFRSPLPAATWGLGLGVLAATLAWPIALYVFGGVTAGGVTVITTVLTGLGVPLGWAVFTASLSADLLDKMITFLLVFAVLRSLPKQMGARFPAAARAQGRS